MHDRPLGRPRKLYYDTVDYAEKREQARLERQRRIWAEKAHATVKRISEKYRTSET